ncbi:hypothetical protein BDZ89DRAFT_973663, partial [Hymenopellis radicata]
TRNIMRDNMIISLTGIEGEAMGIDMNIEHPIKELKKLLTVKGLETTWDELGDISAAIEYFRRIKKKFASEISTAYQGTSHTIPNTQSLSWRVANKARDEGFQNRSLNRRGNANAKNTTNVIRKGRTLIQTSTIPTFRKKIDGSRIGIVTEEELDTVGVPEYGEAEVDIDNES